MEECMDTATTVSLQFQVTEEALKAQDVWKENNYVPIEYIRQAIGDLSEPFSASAPLVHESWKEERAKLRALTRAERLKRDCPFPPEPDLV